MFNLFFSVMGGRKLQTVGGRHNKTFTEEQLQQAILAVKTKSMSEREASIAYGVPKSTINRKKNNKNMLSVGRPCVLQDEEDKSLVEGLITASKWGFPLTCFEVRLIVKHYLNRKGVTAKAV